MSLIADETTVTWANLLREAKGPLVEALKWKTVLLAEVQRDKSPRRWNGKQVTIPIYLSPQQGTGMITETGTLNTPIVVDTTQANIQSAIIAISVSFSTQVMKQATADDNGWAEVLPTKMDRAENAFKRVINEQMCGNKDALLASATGAGSNTTTLTVGTSANFYQLYPGRVVDILTRSNGTPVTSGAGRKIVTTSISGGTISLDVAITTSTNEGVYIQGSYGNALQGIGAAAATTGIFEGINKANVQQWQGTDASPATATDPTLAVFDRAERLSAQISGDTPSFYLCDPAVVDKFSQGLTVQARWSGEEGQLQSGWSGVRYRNKLLVPEFDMPASTAYGINLNDMAIYTLDDGPDWDDYTGSVMQRFGNRSLPLEAWLVWMLQLGFMNCNSVVKVGNLNRAP